MRKNKKFKKKSQKKNYVMKQIYVKTKQLKKIIETSTFLLVIYIHTYIYIYIYLKMKILMLFLV